MRARNLRIGIAGGAVVALVATIAVIASGYDAREVPRAEPGVWVERDAGQYARVNTDTGELDVVRSVAEPSDVVQSGDRSVLFSHGNGRAWAIDASNPVDLGSEDDEAGDDAGNTAEKAVDTDASDEPDASAPGAVTMPDGTRDIVTAGRYVGVRTESGAVYAGELLGDSVASATAASEDLETRLSSLQPVTPEDAGDSDAQQDDDRQAYAASAISLDDDGTLTMFSAKERTIRSYSIAHGVFSGDAERTPEAASDGEDPQLTTVDDRWALLDGETGRLWREGAEETSLDVEGEAVLQSDSGAATGKLADAVLVADTAGLWAVAADGTADRIVEAEGSPAQPVEVEGKRYAAWLGQSGGSLWTGDGGEAVPLAFDDSVEDPGELDPVFRTNGERAVLSDARTGMIWTLPDAELIPLSQWTISDPPKEDRGAVVVDDVTEQVPPTAVADSFGVRAGEPAQLPVLLNDFDPNKRDVLTIVPESLGESPLPDEFGKLQILTDQQSLVVRTDEKASGSVSFTYRITDGERQSDPATVTLDVVPEGTNSGPEWCPVEGCQRDWGVPAIVPGGTLVTPLLEGWVDPEGDVMTLASVTPAQSDAPVRTMVTSDGQLALKHTDPNAGASDIMVRVTVQDSRGEETTRELQVAVRPNATAEYTPTAATVKQGESLTVEPLERLAGGSGSFAVVDAVMQSGGERVRATAQPASGAVVVEGLETGSAVVALSFRDTVTGAEISGLMRVGVTESSSALVLPALRAYVRPLMDSTVEVLDTVPGASARSLSVASAKVVDGDDLRADVIAHARVRVSGSTSDGGPGKIGAVDLTVAEGDARGTGRLTVFQVPESSGSGAIAVSDTATVRAGEVVDIRVLDNDVTSPGERLLLSPDVVGSGEKGELAFASGSTLRYLAPKKPGTYRLSYTAYGASTPEAGDVGAVYVTVVGDDANRDPQPAPLTVRVAAGEQNEVQVPLSGVDPDGDRLQVTGVDVAKDPQLTASVSSRGSSLVVAASESAKAGTQTLAYSVRDGHGGKAKGTLRVIVTDGEQTENAPIAVTDQLRLVPDTKKGAVVRPLDNDIDPANGKLSIVSVEPNVPGGEKSAEYRKLADRLDLDAIKQGRVVIASDDELGTVSYRYTVRSSATKSTSDGLIVVQTSERVGVQAPSVSDTVLNVRDRSSLADEGVDVVTDRVRWSSGDVSSLKLSLPKGQQSKGYRVEKNRIVGEYKPDGDLVTFRLTGTDITGEEVSTYGFLIVPPLDDLRLTLQSGLRPLTVDENESVDARVADLVELGADDEIELSDEAFPVGRANASCAASDSETLRYTAGKEAPWQDTCLMSVRLVGQKNWTVLPVPINILPKEPVAQLEGLTRTIAPAATETIELTDMVTWQGGREGDASSLRFSVSGGGSQFDISASGSRLEATARADASPGAEEAITVAVSGAGDAQATLTLRVGQAPSEQPRGGTVALTCKVGDPCSTKVIGAAGEYDPFAGKSGGGLKLESVNSGNCTVGSFTASGGDSVSVNWSGDRTAGSTCTAGFTVRDAQGRVGEGSIALDAQGIPSAPTIQQTGYDATSATFTVTLSGQAHPGVDGVSLEGGGSSSCSPQGSTVYTCVASGLRNGDKHEFTARAVNSVGESDPSNAVTAWAYKSPDVPKISVESIENPGNTDQGSGGVRLTVQGDSEVREFRVSYRGADGGTISGSGGTKEYTGLAVGGITFSVTPVTRHEVPSVGGGSAEGQAATKDGFVIGAPKLGGATLSPDGTVTAEGAGAHHGESLDYRYTASLSGQPLGDCRTGGQSSNQFDNLPKYRKAHAKVCVSSDYGVSSAESGDTRIGDSVPGPGGKLDYSISTSPEQDSARSYAFYDLASQPSPSGEGDATIQYEIGGAVTESFQISGDQLPNAKVRQCFDTGDEGSCSGWTELGFSGAPTTARVEVRSGSVYDAEQTYSKADLLSMFAFSGAANGSADVNAGTPSGTTIPITVTWTGAFAGLGDTTFDVTYKPKPTPETGDTP